MPWSRACLAGDGLAQGPRAHPVVALWDPGLFAIGRAGDAGPDRRRQPVQDRLAGRRRPQRRRDDGRPTALAPDHRPRRAEDPERRRGDGHRLGHAGAAGLPARAARTASTPSPPATRRATPSSASPAAASRHLTRDELQGVIAHEFSHILNGDMRLNIRLIGVLYGILVLGMTGWIIFRSTANSYQFDRRDDDGAAANPWPLVGLALYVLGYVGVFFGNLIKAAVSPPARVPGRRLGRAVHPQSRRDRRGAQEDRRRWPRARASRPPRPRRPATCSSATPLRPTC